MARGRFVVLSVYVLLVTYLQNFNLVEGKPLTESLERSKITKCGYESCPKVDPNALNVHLVPHSHDDVGWLKTVDQYYYGTKTNIQRADVNSIITSVVKALQENPERRFIQVETAFFYKWWHEQNKEVQDQVHKLVQNGQLEFTGGAWSMNDEGAVHYQSIVDQFTFGLKFLKDTFGECARPRVGWQIDPFGHSSEMASLFAQMGYDGLFFARLDWRDKTLRMQEQRAEMIWQGSASLGNESNIFTSVLYNHYSAPKGFCFDVLCQEDPIVTDQQSSEYNYEAKVKSFQEFIVKQAKSYKTNNILITMGDDFNYQDALYYFRNMDTLINGFQKWPQHNGNQPINLIYSTPACYVQAVNEAVKRDKIDLPLETNDFFPYASDYHAYWSGYFTSRPASKRSERLANNLNQVHKQILAADKWATNTTPQLYVMQNAVGIMQHHDAITGTEKQHVANDYARILDEAFIDNGRRINGHFSESLAWDANNFVDLELKQCLLKNQSICKETEGDAFTLFVYNPVGRSVWSPIRVPVNNTSYEVTLNGTVLKHQISPSMQINVTQPTHKYELTFIALLPPLGTSVFYVKKTHEGLEDHLSKKDSSRSRFRIGNKKTSVTLSQSTGLVHQVKMNNKEVTLRQELLFYLSAQGDNSAFGKRSSGAYIFRSLYSAIPINREPINVTTYKGDLFDEVHQVYSTWAKQIVRIYHDSNINDHVEFDWAVGPIPVDDKQGKEVISRFTSDLISWEDFYTDSNGREMLHRIRDYRPTYNYSKEEPIAGNYYPVTSQITIKDDSNTRISVLNDRAQGGSSLQSGEMELMVHRRMLFDDAFGVGEALNEKDGEDGLTVRGTHYLMFTSNDEQIKERHLAEKIALAPWILITKRPIEDFGHLIKSEREGLRRDLPDDVRILTLESISNEDNLLLLRLENILDSKIGKTTTIDVKNLFSEFDIVSMEETILSGNAHKNEVRKMSWGLDSDNSSPVKVQTGSFDEPLTVTLNPMQIKTFIIKVNYI